MKWDKENFKISESKGLVKVLAIVGVVGLLLSLPFAFSDQNAFYYSYLTSFLFWFTIALGTLAWLLIHNLTNSKWSVVLRRIWENLAFCIPFMAILFIPVLIGMKSIYKWSAPDKALKTAVKYKLIDGDLKKVDADLKDQKGYDETIESLDAQFAKAAHHGDHEDHGDGHDKKSHKGGEESHEHHESFSHKLLEDSATASFAARFKESVFRRTVVKVLSEIHLTGDIKEDVAVSF